jgi:hypothetical protein
LGAALAAPAADLPLSFHAAAVNLSNVGRPGLTTLEITIERWTTDEEAAKLRDALIEKGDDKLMGEIQKIKPRAGFIRSGKGGLGWDIAYARRTEIPGGGHRVVFGTDRPMSFAERSSQPRSADYDFLVGEMRIGANGKGEGKLVPRAKIAYNADSRTIEIENYATEPVRLTEVTESGPKGK